MHRIVINKLGPIDQCDFQVENLCILTGEQASGKSTIAKAIYFFRTIKDEIYSITLKKHITSNDNIKIKNLLEKALRSKFLQIFGSSWSMDMNMSMEYYYSENTWVQVALTSNSNQGDTNFIFSKFSQNIYDYIRELDTQLWGSDFDIKNWRTTLEQLFHDDYESIFIPAGREMITLLTNQLSYIFTVMDDNQKRSIDYCTQSYIEQILRIKPLFESGMRGMYKNKLLLSQDSINKKMLNRIMDVIDGVLKGRYLFVSGEERLVLDNHKYVKMNFTSSGQQESMWIFNLIFYYVLENKKTFLILEEPESHLYPEAQKNMAELIALFINAGNSGIVTTHSPYLLGSFNNLFYASYLGKKDLQKVNNVISQEKWLNIDTINALFVSAGSITSILDDMLPMINNEVIDGISTVINEENDALMQIHAYLEN